MDIHSNSAKFSEPEQQKTVRRSCTQTLRLSGSVQQNSLRRFFEWSVVGKHKQPFHFRRTDGKPVFFAGMWERWGRDLLRCCLITTDANAVASPVHNRMPVILTNEGVKLWLDKDTPMDKLTAILLPAADDFLEAIAVSRYVNSPKNDGPECVEPISEKRSE